LDITQLILDDHEQQRRMFAALDEVDRDAPAALATVWDRLATFLEVHARAEEERQGLADFRRHAAAELRHDLGVRFAAYEAEHADGVEVRDLDPDEYVAEHG